MTIKEQQLKNQMKVRFHTHRKEQNDRGLKSLANKWLSEKGRKSMGVNNRSNTPNYQNISTHAFTQYNSAKVHDSVTVDEHEFSKSLGIKSPRKAKLSPISGKTTR
jgi:hypothetical protein